MTSATTLASRVLTRVWLVLHNEGDGCHNSVGVLLPGLEHLGGGHTVAPTLELQNGREAVALPP